MSRELARDWQGRLASALMVAGILAIILPVAYALYGNWQVRRDQAEALEQWRPSQIGIPAGLPHAGRIEGPKPPRLPEIREDPSAAMAEAWPWELEIPRINLSWLIYEGADLRALRRRGAGHIAWTSVPWRGGTVGIAGHRTTYGAPFFRLDRLRPGDIIRLTTARGAFVYKVTGRQQVLPTAARLLASQPGTSRLALVTCSPSYSARFRLVVVADLFDVEPQAQGHSEARLQARHRDSRR
jgi:sortase A